MILTKPHTWIELSATEFDRNVATYKQILGPKKKIGAVVKSNAYGHGLSQIGNLCENNPAISMLCVSNLSEAIELRNQNIKKPILVMGVIDEDPCTAAHKKIAVPAYDKKTIKKLSILAQQEKKHIAIHLKIDTGLSRFGFFPHEALEAAIYARQQPFITLEGIFTHCAEPNSKEYTRHQLDQFAQVCTQLDAAGIKIPYRHAANSAIAGAYMHKYSCLNMARIGAGIYGFWHSPEIKAQTQAQHPQAALTPILNWKTKIAAIKQLPANTFVGYDRTYCTQRPTTIAIIPIGYHESYDRKLYTDSRLVLIKNQYAPVIGRVSMNATILDITELRNIQEGDHVTLIGNHQHLSATELVALIGNTNPREVITRLCPSIARTIVSD